MGSKVNTRKASIGAVGGGSGGGGGPSQPDHRYYVSGAAAAAAAQVAAPAFLNGSFAVLYPGSPASEAGTWQITANNGFNFPADYTKVSDLTDTAAEVAIADFGGNFSGSYEVEAALAAIGNSTPYGVRQVLVTPGGTTLIDALPSMIASAVWLLDLVEGTSLYKCQVSAISDGTNANSFETDIVTNYVGVLPITFDVVELGGGNLILNALSTEAVLNWTCRFIRLRTM